jgi:hypothetical protein
VELLSLVDKHNNWESETENGKELLRGQESPRNLPSRIGSKESQRRPFHIMCMPLRL